MIEAIIDEGQIERFCFYRHIITVNVSGAL